MRRKSNNKRISRGFLGCMLAAVVAVAAFPMQKAQAAAGAGSVPAVSYYGQARQFVFTPGTQENPADLFDMFRGLMPGDEREQEITLRSAAESGAPINLFLRAYVPALDENATEKERAEAEKAKAFLEKLTATVTCDEFSDRPMLDAGSYPEQGMESWVFLGRFEYNTSSILRVKVSVPEDLGNDFQKIDAKVRWAFLVEEFNDTPENPGNNPGTENPTPDVPGNQAPGNPGNQTPGTQTPGPVAETTGGQAPGTVAETTGDQTLGTVAETTVNQTTGNAAQTVVPAQNVQNNVTAGQEAEEAAELTELEDIPTPLAPPADEELGLPEEEVPLAGMARGACALLNLIIALVTVAGCMILLLSLKKQEEEETAMQSTEERKRKTLICLSGIVPAVVSVAAFLLTEDTSAPMIFADRWTWLMILIGLVQATVCVLAYRSKRTETVKVSER